MAQPAFPTVHRFTRAEYHDLTRAGLFHDLRVELLEGEIVNMAAKRTPHSCAVNRINRLLTNRLRGALVRIQDPIVLDDLSEPEPDVAICEETLDEYASAHPTAAQVLLPIEVADTSLEYDLGRKVRLTPLPRSARSGWST